MVRWVHLYLSMVGFAALFFFSVTGLTLNHPTWLGASEEHMET
ncbi:MAG: PepSY-associated TM helix domain-containing protein, partial [Planctomycetales bacterium]|nr:PepSY-associated TM helix domain-containing protein [Planctomycetales bacterium]